MALTPRLAAAMALGAAAARPAVAAALTASTSGGALDTFAHECLLCQRRASSSEASWRPPAPSPRSSRPPAPVPPSPLDAFTAGLQSKTEQQLLQLIQQAQERKLAGGQAAAEGEKEEEEEQEEVPNAETGEMYGPRGKEPTRYGDWENKGKCIDF